MKLRSYQEKIITRLVNLRGENKHSLVHLATGAGKSILFKKLADLSLKKNKKVLFLVAGTSILNQAVTKHFSEITNDISLMQGSKKYKLSKLLCASIDTLSRRKSIHDEIIKEYDLIIIDECHLCTAKRYKTFLDKIPKDKWVIGFTATPYRIGKKGHGFWHNIIKEISILELIEQNFLMRPKIFSAPIMNTKKIKKTGGDFNSKHLFQENNKLKIYSNIINEYKEKADGKRAICFAINIDHSKQIAKEFNEVGIKAEHVDADTPQHEREAAIKRLENDEIQILCNVNIFSIGIDIPSLECGLLARPTESKILWLQQVGRILRTHKDAKSCIILDFGGNCERLGHPLSDFDAEITDLLPGKKLEPLEKTIKTRRCPECYFILISPTQSICPECNAVVKTPMQIKREEKIKLIEVQFGTMNPYLEIRIHIVDKFLDEFVDFTKATEKQKSFINRKRKLFIKHDRKKPNFLLYQIWAEFGAESKIFVNYPSWFRG